MGIKFGVYVYFVAVGLAGYVVIYSVAYVIKMELDFQKLSFLFRC